MSSDQDQSLHRTVVSYVMRGGRMTSGQQRAWDRRWHDLGGDVADVPAGPIDFAEWFGRKAPVVLEIGSGMGETTAELAAQRPDVNHVAVEVYKPGLAQLIMRADDRGVDNLRLLRGDAMVLLREHIEPSCLAEVRVFFPDPWPKKKHHKRRLVQPPFVELVASKLVSGGVLHMATDWESYAEQMLEVCTANQALRNLHADEPQGWAPRPDWRPVTKFEQRAHTEGRLVNDLLFERA